MVFGLLSAELLEIETVRGQGGMETLVIEVTEFKSEARHDL